MRIGILADIHDAVILLEHALQLLRQHDAEQVVTLGDAFESYRPGTPAVEVARMLERVGAVGVWGNHDFGLSHEVTDQLREEADEMILSFAARLTPQLAVGGCRFCHIEPWKNPCSLADLWSFDEVPNTGERARRTFDAVPERVVFMGHFHSWFAVTQDGPTTWRGENAIDLLAPERYLVSVGAVLRGSCAIYDTVQSRLTPLRCPTSG